MKHWAVALKRVKKEMNLAIVAANNHYAGLGPSSANSFRKMIGLDEVVWEEMKKATLD